jgi:hypothetical protein
MITDMIDRPINVGDWVVFYSNIYRVVGLGKEHRDTGRGTVRLMIWNGGTTARPVNKHSKDIAVLEAKHVTMWLLKNGATA